MMLLCHVFVLGFFVVVVLSLLNDCCVTELFGDTRLYQMANPKFVLSQIIWNSKVWVLNA